MKVCFINTLYYPNIVGGAERSVQFLAEELVRKGHQAVVISLASQHGTRSSEHNGVIAYTVGHRLVPWPFREGGIPWFFKPYYFALDSFYNPFICHAVGKILSCEKPDVVHTNNILGFSPQVWSLVKTLGIPLVHTLRDHSLLCTRSTMWKDGHNCQKQCLPCRIHTLSRKKVEHYVDGVVGNSKHILKTHSQNDLFEFSAIKTVIYNAYELKATEHSITTSSEHRDSVCFGFLGRIERSKGIELLLDAFTLISNRYNCNLLLAGTGDAAYTSNLKERYTAQSIQFLGFIAPHNLFDKIDALIVPSLGQEPLARGIFEAYSHGIPVIGSNRGGTPEIIIDGKTGLLLDPSVPEALVEKLHYACNNLQQMKDMKAACLEMAKRFLPEVIVSQYLDIYKKVVSMHQVTRLGGQRS